MGRASAAIGLVLIVAFSLAGCSVPRNGLTGMTVDVGGNLTAVFAWCDDNPPDSAILYDPSGFNGKTVAEYQAPELTGHTARVRLDVPADGWVVKPAPPVLDRDTSYSIFGGRQDNRASTEAVTFHVADRDRLSDGTILIQAYDNAARKWVDTLVSLADFERQAKTYC